MTTNKIQDFTDLIVWQKGHNLVLEIYKITSDFPNDERYCLTNQIRRSASSITSNIAEGFGRNTAKDKNQFYSISKGSALETKNHLILAKDLQYLKNENFESLNKEISAVIRLISGLMRSSVDRRY